MVEAINFMSGITVDPAKLVSALGDTCYAMGTALKTVSEQSQKQGLSEEERHSRRARKAATLNAVIQNIEAMIQHLSQDDDNHSHVLALSAIQHSCTHALKLDHDCHEHHELVDHAAAMAFAMAHSIRAAAERDDGADEAMEDHNAHSTRPLGHAARVGRRIVHRAIRPTFDPLAGHKVSGVIQKAASGIDARALLSNQPDQPENRLTGGSAVAHGLLETIHNKFVH